MKCPVCNGDLEEYFTHGKSPTYHQDGDVILTETVYWCPTCRRLQEYYEIFKMTDSGFRMMDLNL